MNQEAHAEFRWSAGEIQISVHSSEGNHRIVWKEADILETETTSMCSKYK